MPSTSKPPTVEPQRRRTRIALLFWAFALAGVAAFGLSQTSASKAGRTHVVRIENMMFSPGVVKIRRGERVTFENHDLVPHTATAKEKKLFDSGIVKAGETWSFTPAKESTIAYACTFHPTMEGSIVVEAP